MLNSSSGSFKSLNLSINDILFNGIFQGLRRSEQHAMLDLFRSRLPTPSTPDANSKTASRATPELESSRIKRLERLIKKQF